VAPTSKQGVVKKEPEKEPRTKSQGKEHHHKKDHVKEKKVDEKPAALSKSKTHHRETSNGTAVKCGREDDLEDVFVEKKDPRVRETGKESVVKVSEKVKDPRVRDTGREGAMKGSEQLDTPLSPMISSRSSHSSIRANIESELSSGEDFKEGDRDRDRDRQAERKAEPPGRERPGSRKQKRKDSVDYDIDRHSRSNSTPRPRTPDYPVDETEWKSMPHTPPFPDRGIFSEDDEDSGRGSSRKSRRLPRRYQMESGSDQGSSTRREGGR